MIIRNYATNLIFFAQLARSPPQRGRPATARQADGVPIAVGISTSKSSVYHIVSCFLIFIGAIEGIRNWKNRNE